MNNKDSCPDRFLLLQSIDISATTAGHQLHRTHDYIPIVPLAHLRTNSFPLTLKQILVLQLPGP